MGVPAFFRWLSRKYPSVIVECVENKTTDTETGENVYEDASLPNPNGVEFDNLYLDMNGIIHPCTHPEDKPPPKNEDEMMIAIFECIDRLFAIVRPRKLLYMAIDGVAPRAKMNQQRSRRFRASKETVEKRLEIERIRTELTLKGCVLPPEKPKEEHFDSNCITPGTPFMDKLSKCLHYYIHDRMNNNPAWKGIKVILSDANVPGEGEHKIMDYIRKQRAQPDHDANTQHVLCGADADLIMLGLATHEPNFTIIREEFLPNKPRPCEICQQFGHEMDKCVGLDSAGMSQVMNKGADVPICAEVKFIFVRLCVLREYLKKNLEMPNLPFKYDFERVIDDWVFMCFFVGNDFLPHLPSLEIREGAIDRLVTLYKKCVYRTGGWLTNSGEVNLERVQLIMTDLGNAEDQIFKDRQRREQQYKAREKSKKRRDDEYNSNVMEKSSVFRPELIAAGANQGKITNYKEEAALLRKATMQQNDGDSKGDQSRKRKAPQDDGDEDDDVNDEVRLWEDGFKDRYYESKFDVSPNNKAFRYSVALQYVRGLCWVLKYYYQGCASWNWYFPYHYAPFASDFVNIAGLSTMFEHGTKPFNPLEQLMGVFPAASNIHVPKPWAALMSDPDSPIIDFYPEDFKIDLNGKKFAWQGVALLPFVDEKRLFKALAPLYKQLTKDEERRNQLGENRLYVGKLNSQFNFINQHCKSKCKQQFTPILMEGMRGTIAISDDNIELNGSLQSPIKGLYEVTDNSVISVSFRDPEFAENYIFMAERLPKAIDPPNVLAPENKSSNYRPVIGFNRPAQQAYVPDGGRRMINSAIPHANHQNHWNYNGDRGNFDMNNSRGGGGNPYRGRGDNYRHNHGGQFHPYGNFNQNNYNNRGGNYQRNYNGNNDPRRGRGNFHRHI